MDLTIGTIIGDFILIAGSFLLLIFLVKKFAWGNITSILDARAEKITNDIDEAEDRVIAGPSKKNKTVSERDRQLVAYHEAGHAVMTELTPGADPVHKVTIIPRGGTGGVTWFIPERDQSYTSIYEFKDILARAMGGRIAEKLILGDDGITTGASSDLRSATNIARDMVIEQGMGKKLRNHVFHEDTPTGNVFDTMSRERPYSEETAKLIDEEVSNLVDEATKRAEIVLTKNREGLKKLALALLDKETLDDKEVNEILKDTKLPTEAKLHE